MITAFVGLPGEGKTLSMVRMACKALKDNRNVVANFPVKDNLFGTGREALVLPDIGSAIYQTENALICIDEASIVLPNHYWEKLPFDLLIRFAQVRKYGLDIMYTSQGYHHTVKRLRDLTNYVVRCTNHKWWFTNQYIDPEFYDMRVPVHYLKDYVKKTTRYFLPSFPKLFKCFDTMFVVKQSVLANNTYNVHNFSI
jgi:hypothetical protein